jgi:predicted DNA-binding protein with PD1-like motif
MELGWSFLVTIETTPAAVMRQQLLSNDQGRRTFAVVLQSGDEVMSCLQQFIKDSNISTAQLTAIGAFSDVTLGYFDWATKDYLSNAIEEQVELASLIGDVALAPSGEPSLHVHVVVGKRDGSALAGHLKQGHVRPTLEVVLTESPAHLQKVHDQETGLALIRPRA